VAWVGIDGGNVHHNTIYLSEKWVGRILQENTDSRFGQCRNGKFEHNIVVYDQRVRTLINVGGNTEPQSFTFRGNAWFSIDSPDRGPSNLPVAETDGIFGVDPQLEIEATTNLLKVRSRDPKLQGIGAGAFRQAGEPK
jgi:hypothetical protein